MAFSTGFQLVLDLANVFPLREGLVVATTSLINFARQLRLSGSDIIIEADLAAVFGRGKVSAELTAEFRTRTSVAAKMPLTADGEIILKSGPGPSLQRAFKEPDYFSTIVQLSFLSWIHSRDTLATMLSQTLRKRYEMGVEGAAPDPGYESIAKTLQAINAQTSNFSWTNYLSEVEARIRTIMPCYKFSSAYLALSSSVLLGAMDYFCLVQSLPEARKVTVSNETGSITLIIWAHYILQLNVTVIFGPNRVLYFGNPDNPQLTITWAHLETRSGSGELEWYQYVLGDEPVIQYLDSDTNLLAKPSVTTNTWLRDRALVEERHTVRNYGSTYLYRLFNTNFITPEGDAAYSESANLVTALAIHANSRMKRNYIQRHAETQRLSTAVLRRFNEFGIDTESSRRSESDMLADLLPKSQVEVWRILAAAKVLFSGIDMDTRVIEANVTYLSKTALGEQHFPTTFSAYLKKSTVEESESAATKRFVAQVRHLAKIVLLFARVVNLQACVEMPIRMVTDMDHVQLASAMTKICKGPQETASISSYEVFHGLACLLDSGFDNRDDRPESSSRFKFVSVCSDFGWSIFLDSVVKADPADCQPELVHIERGTPSLVATGEQKYRIRDGGGFRVIPHPDVYPVEHGPCYKPRAAARIIARREYWTPRLDEFEASIHYSIKPSNEWCQSMTQPVDRFDDSSEHRNMHDTLWDVHLTKPCMHGDDEGDNGEGTLGIDAVAVIGYTYGFEAAAAAPQRIAILLTRGETGLRWLAVVNNAHRSRQWDSYRSCMLRTKNCCANCALEQVAQRPGKWMLIL